VHNAIAAAGLMRRALVEAREYAARRVAFDHPIAAYPGVRAVLARIRVRAEAALATTFRLLDLTDRIDTGENGPKLVGARRIGVMLNKYWTAIHASRVTRDGIEVLGGNGTIEDFSPLPRLYRDAIVVESWEGTHNTLCAQVLRDFATRELHRPWLELVAGEVERLDDDTATTARLLLADVEDRLERLLAADPNTAAGWIRTVVDRMCVLTDWMALATQACWDAEHGHRGALDDCLALYRRLEIDRPDPMADPDRLAIEARLALGACSV
jgi:hypothetical protein